MLFTEDEQKFLLQHDREDEAQRKAASDLNHKRFVELEEKGIQRLKWYEEIVGQFFDRLIEERQWGKVTQVKDGQPIQVPEVPKPEEVGWDVVFDWYYTYGQPRRMPITELATKIGYTTRYVYSRRDDYDSRHGMNKRKRQHKKA